MLMKDLHTYNNVELDLDRRLTENKGDTWSRVWWLYKCQE